jgi:uncharacterized glyoxalase superfamily protein PhnB
MTTTDTSPLNPIDRIMQGVIPYITVKGADEAVAFYQRAFGAEQIGEHARDDKGRIMNASLVIHGGCLMVMEEMPEHGAHAFKSGAGCTLQLVVADGDAWWARAVEAGCTVTAPFEMQFWGDRWGMLTDPFGVAWAIDCPPPEKLGVAQ